MEPGEPSSSSRPDLSRLSPTLPSVFFHSSMLPSAGAGVKEWSGSGSGAAGGLTLTWQDLSVYAKLRHHSLLHSSSTEYRKIINNVSGAVPAGSLVAIMGASGSGKSTLMAALAYQTSASLVVDGDVRVNGRPLGPYVRHMCGYMAQHDLFTPSLTVNEYLRFMARLKLDRRTSSGHRELVIRKLVTLLGLSHCADSVICFDSSGQGMLSGGERKRVSFAAACLTDPPLLFCDEPTSGLDACSATALVQALQTMAAAGKTILCTIHQPSSELFTMFHQLVLLTNGRVAFIGPTSQALPFFDSLGYECPENFNPAEHLVRSVAPTPGSQRHLRNVCEAFGASEYARAVNLQIGLQHLMADVQDEILDSSINSYKQQLWVCKLWWLSHTAAIQILRDPKVQQIRIMHKILIAVMVGLCFVGSVQLSQAGVQATQGALFMLVTENTFGPMYAMLPLFPTELPLFLRHYQAGLYGPLAYYLAKVITILPGLVVEPVLFTAILYWLAGLQSTVYAFVMTAFVVTLCINVSTACGCFFSATFDSVPLAMTYLIPFDYSIMITSGVFIKLNTLSPQIGWIQYLSWMMYSNEAMTIVQWQNVNNITCDETQPYLPCVHSGQEVLDRYSFSENHLWRDIVALCALFATFHFLAFLGLRRRIKLNS